MHIESVSNVLLLFSELVARASLFSNRWLASAMLLAPKALLFDLSEKRRQSRFTESRKLPLGTTCCRWVSISCHLWSLNQKPKIKSIANSTFQALDFSLFFEFHFLLTLSSGLWFTSDFDLTVWKKSGAWGRKQISKSSWNHTAKSHDQQLKIA
jgi:hypothetical protein